MDSAIGCETAIVTRLVSRGNSGSRVEEVQEGEIASERERKREANINLVASFPVQSGENTILVVEIKIACNSKRPTISAWLHKQFLGS